jgi:hypothetical protein
MRENKGGCVPHLGSASGRFLLLLAVLSLPLPGFGFDALAHGMAGKDADFVAHSTGPNPAVLLSGRKHMATGYDHLAFVIGTVFFLYRLRHVAIYVTTFSVGHSHAAVGACSAACM